MSLADGFEEFLATADAGSLTAAARELGIPRPTLSRRLARLEEELGAVLIRRSTRSLHLTAAGERFYAKARYVVDTAREARAEVERLDGQPRGTLRVTTPAEVPAELLAAWMGEFLDRYPEVSVELSASSHYQDLIGGGVDVALRADVPQDSPVVIRTLHWNQSLAIASPEYLAAHGTPGSVEDLDQHRLILGYGVSGQPQRSWPLVDGGSVPVQGRLALNLMGARLEAAAQGHGISLVVDSVAQRALQQGRVQPVLEGVVGRRERLCLAYADRRHLDPKIRVFVDFMAERLGEIRSAGEAQSSVG